MPQFFQMQDIGAIIPELELIVFGMFLLIFDLLIQEKRKLGMIAMAGIAISGYFLFRLRGVDFTAYGGTMVLDPFAIFFKLIFLIAAALSIAISLKYLDIERENHGEYYALILFSTMGMMFMAGAMDLVTLYIGLETMAIATYVLVGFLKSNQRSNEAAMKYFLLGAFSSGILLYGMSLLYGIAGSTNLGELGRGIAAAVQTAQTAAPGEPSLRPMLLLGMIALAAGLFFKIAAVPFHMWAPDAYEGAPTSVTAFLSTGSKAASFALYARIFVEALPSLRADWAPLLGLVAAITIMVGNWAAATQENARRLLAYSSISTAGYLLLALVAGNSYGYIGLVIYL